MISLAEIVERCPDIAKDDIVRWCRVDLRDVIAARFGVRLHERSVGKLLARLGLRHISVRRRSMIGSVNHEPDFE